MELIEIKEILRKASVEVDVQGHGRDIALFETDFERVAIELLKKLTITDVVGPSEQLPCDVCGSNDVIEAPHMGRNCNRCNPL